MGMLFVGPMGTGKTYIAEAFASGSGLTCLKFKNGDKWVLRLDGEQPRENSPSRQWSELCAIDYR